MLSARTDTTDYIEAAEAVRGVAYVCRDCRAPAILKKGALRIAHFAHLGGAAIGFLLMLLWRKRGSSVEPGRMG